MANSGESQQQCLQRLCQSWQRNQAWSGRRERATGIEPAFSAWEAECCQETMFLKALVRWHFRQHFNSEELLRAYCGHTAGMCLRL